MRVAATRSGDAEMYAVGSVVTADLAHNASSQVEYFDLPLDRVISMSAQIEV